ncbi:MAG: T9SS type A sorting domain-containing protein, partial [Bacteroidales bacterium]|nr:T9SS type A sorting domain-containing protein [Bacteroidales bacterium]
ITPQGSGVVSGGGTFNHGATANAAAAIYAGYQFVAWEENGEVVSTSNPYSFTVTSGRSLLAVLESTAKTLVLAVEGLGTTYPPPGTYTHQLNANISVAAVANPGWHFVKWEIGDEVITEANLQLSMTEDITAKAFFSESVSTNDLTQENGLRVYPQPASLQLHIEWSNLAGHAVIEMFNLSGQRMILVEEHASSQGMLHTTIDVSQLQSGLYLMRITSNGNAIMQKVMIQ